MEDLIKEFMRYVEGVYPQLEELKDGWRIIEIDRKYKALVPLMEVIVKFGEAKFPYKFKRGSVDVGGVSSYCTLVRSHDDSTKSY
jgi:hypothetical protein